MRVRLTLLIAPPAAGKTARLRQWQRTSVWPTAWLTLTPMHNAPERFLFDLCNALQRLCPVASAPETTLVDLVNSLLAVPGDFAVILDDYHILEAAPVHVLVTRLLDYPPPALHLFLASRAIPPLPLARWRARRQLLELWSGS